MKPIARCRGSDRRALRSSWHCSIIRRRQEPSRVIGVMRNVSGQVIEISVKPSKPVKAGDVLFQIDWTSSRVTSSLLLF